jgi:hypothetical protein
MSGTSNAGRPALFKSEEELELMIQEYFNNTPDHEITITGLALYLGFASRQSLHDYEEKDKYSYIIKRARLTVANSYEKELRRGDKPAAGIIFGLKNIDKWTDKQEISQNITADVTTQDKYDTSKLSSEELDTVETLLSKCERNNE